MATAMAWLALALLGACLAAAGERGGCGDNVVPPYILHTEPCRPRASRDDLDVSDAELEEEVHTGLQKGARLAQKLLEHEKQVSEWLNVPLFTPEYHHYLTNEASDSDKQQVKGVLQDLANATALARHLSKQFNIPPEAMGDFLISLKVPADPAHVLQIPTCDASDIYRRHNASCNNLEHPAWGMTSTAYTRLVKSVFLDGINEPKKSVTGKELPNPRVLRTHLFPTGDFNDKINSLMYMQFGQIIAHDTALSADSLGFDGLGVECCSHNATPLPCKSLSIGCYPVKISKHDKYYADKGVTCMSVARSMKKYTVGGYLGPGEGTNTDNHILDCSFTYGSDKDRADQLRAFDKGQLRTQELPDGRKVLPQNDNPMQSCSLPTNNGTCFFAGDGRVNQNTQLSALQIVFLREHNRIAHELYSMNSHWNDEKIYQEARRIFIAEYQHIVYNEYLPQILREEWLEKFHLKPNETGYSNCYDTSINPATMIEFTHAIFRVFHGVAQSDLLMYKDIGCPVGKIKIGKWMDKPEVLVQDQHLNQLTLGLTQQPATKDDKWTVYELNRNLFRVDQAYGQDLDMFDILRGRDNGLGSYNDYRELINLPRAKKFEDFADLMSYEDAMALSHFYEHPDDVELMMVLLEKKNQDILSVREAILCEQFYRWKCGDRFFYDYSGSPYPFTQDQINEIKKATMSRLLCDNADNITRIQPNSFKLVSSKNQVTDCKNLPVVKLDFWKEDN
ncbi:peroxidase-like [Schistocerca serialis cubense]|uniref:peroxidase-like n=1 Tax=Schistocerca serialis cubense TaxID=2023355 RepID=UPI00214E8F95|nr:peroxidase-like [Schistocerca serialis cubense]